MALDELPRAFRRHWSELHDAEEFARLGGVPSPDLPLGGRVTLSPRERDAGCRV